MRVGSYLFFVFNLAKGTTTTWLHNFCVHDHALQTSSCTRKLVHWQNVICSSLTSKMIVPLWRNLWQLSAGKNQLHSLCFPDILQRYCKFVVLGTLGMPGYAHPKWYHQYEETFMFICRQKIISYPMLFRKYCKVMQTYFGYFGHAWFCTAKMIISTFRRI